MAAVWNREPVARGGRARGGDDDSPEDGPHEVDLGDDGADGVDCDHHDDGELSEDFRSESTYRILVLCECADRAACGGENSRCKDCRDAAHYFQSTFGRSGHRYSGGNGRRADFLSAYS